MGISYSCPTLPISAPDDSSDVVKDQKSFSGLQLLIRLQYRMLYYIAGISAWI